MNITSIHHVHFHYPPQTREALRFFYATVLGAQERRGTGGQQLLQFDLGPQLLRFTPDQHGSSRGQTQHVAFNVQDIGNLRQRLQAFDQVFIDNHATGPLSQVYVKDPAGNQLEFLQSPA